MMISRYMRIVRQSSGVITVNSYDTVTHYKDTRNQIGLSSGITFDGFESVYNSCQFSRGLFD